MSFSYGWKGPNIIKDGLILYLDAGSPNSFYNKTSTNINDISGYGNNGILTNFNSPSPQTIWNSDGGGGIVFDGIDDYINMGDKNIFTQPNGFTFDVYLKMVNVVNSNTILDKYQLSGLEYVFGFNNNRLMGWVYDSTLSGYRGRFVSSISSYISVNQWYNLVFSYDGGTGTTSCKIYINSIQRDDSDFQSGSFSSIRNMVTPLSIGLTSPGTGPGMRASLATFRMYNRALSDSEILQNYNVTKSRFGL